MGMNSWTQQWRTDGSGTVEQTARATATFAEDLFACTVGYNKKAFSELIVRFFLF